MRRPILALLALAVFIAADWAPARPTDNDTTIYATNTATRYADSVAADVEARAILAEGRVMGFTDAELYAMSGKELFDLGLRDTQYCCALPSICYGCVFSIGAVCNHNRGTYFNCYCEAPHFCNVMADGSSSCPD